jgi:hypothetical protein
MQNSGRYLHAYQQKGHPKLRANATTARSFAPHNLTSSTELPSEARITCAWLGALQCCALNRQRGAGEGGCSCHLLADEFAMVVTRLLSGCCVTTHQPAILPHRRAALTKHAVLRWPQHRVLVLDESLASPWLGQRPALPGYEILPSRRTAHLI